MQVEYNKFLVKFLVIKGIGKFLAIGKFPNSIEISLFVTLQESMYYN